MNVVTGAEPYAQHMSARTTPPNRSIFKTVVRKLEHMFDESNKGRVLAQVFRNPEKRFYVRELAERVDAAPSTVSRAIAELEDRGLVETERDIKLYVSASDTDRFRDAKRAFNLWQLMESGLIDELAQEMRPAAIVLFGSYARGEDTSDSDIDIAVVGGREPALDLDTYETLLGRELNLVSVDTEAMDDRFKESLANGIVLRGYLPV